MFGCRLTSSAPTSLHPFCQNLRLEVQLAASVWPVLQTQLGRQRSGVYIGKQATPWPIGVSLLAQLAPGGSTTKGVLVVQLAAGVAPAGSCTVSVPLDLGPPLQDSAVLQLAGALEVAASRAPAPAGLAHLLAASLSCEPDGHGGLALHGAAATPAPILDFKPLLSKRVAPCPLAQRLQEALMHSCPAAADVEVEASIGFGQEPLRALCIPGIPVCRRWINAPHGSASAVACRQRGAPLTAPTPVLFPSGRLPHNGPWQVSSTAVFC